MEKIIFKIGISDWELLSLEPQRDGKTCWFVYKGNFCYIIFQLTNNTYCEWTFFKSSETNKYIPRPKFYKQDKGEVEISADNAKDTAKKKVIIDLKEGDVTKNFWEMINFFQKFKEFVDFGKFSQTFSIADIKQSIDGIKDDNKKNELIDQIIGNYTIAQLERILIKSKKKCLEQFQIMLNDENVNEKIWQKFFDDNKWILSTLSTKLIFENEDSLIREGSAGQSNNRGIGESYTDFIAYNKVMTFVEIKKPTTPIFRKGQKDGAARTNTWSFSSEFIDGVSQCLGQIGNITEKDNYDRNYQEIQCDSKCPKSIFIIGNLRTEFAGKNDKEIKIMRSTFETFRYNSKNVEIITYDELYERVKYIVEELQ